MSELVVFGKRQKARTLPLRRRVVLELEAWSLTPLELGGRPPEPDDFLLYPEKRARWTAACGSPEATPAADVDA